MGACISKTNASAAKSKVKKAADAPQMAKQSPQMAKVDAQGYFISTEQLAKMVQTYPKGKLCIIDATFKPEADLFKEHQEASLPNSIFLDLQLVRDYTKPYPFMMPDPKHFVRVMKSMGVKKSQTLVLYENGNGWFATRAAFMMKAFGHQEVYVLDGGFKKWESEGRQVIKNDESTWETDFDYQLNTELLVDYVKVKEVLVDGSVQVIEARPPPAVQNSGAIEGAISVPGPACLNEDGTVKSKDALKELFESKGIDTTKPMAFSCGAGILATFIHAAAVKAQFDTSLYLYDGSFSEWSAMQAKEKAQ